MYFLQVDGAWHQQSLVLHPAYPPLFTKCERSISLESTGNTAAMAALAVVSPNGWAELASNRVFMAGMCAFLAAQIGKVRRRGTDCFLLTHPGNTSLPKKIKRTSVDASVDATSDACGCTSSRTLRACQWHHVQRHPAS